MLEATTTRGSLLRCLAFALPLAASAAAHAAKVERDELRTGVIFDMGRIEKGEFDNIPVEGQVISNTGVSMIQAVTIEDRLRLTIGVGGLFWYSLPEEPQPHRRYTKFGPAVLQAELSLKLGSLEDPWGNFQFGLIPFKYNPDAKNLGEYLLRSSAYPNVLITGGWSNINSASLQMQGLNFEVRTGPFTHNFLIMLETGLGPQHDITPAYLINFKPHPVFQVGAGAAFASLIPIDNEITTPDGPGHPGDLTTQPLGRYKADTVVTDPNDSVYSNYTYQAIKLMGRASIHPQALLQSDLLGPEDLTLYTEAAVLGWKNYPYYYEKRSHRIPVMVGFNVPTFKLLDMLSVEVEYRNTDFLNSSRVSYGESALPVPYIIPNGNENYADVLKRYEVQRDSLTKDIKFHWSVYAKRSLVPGMTLFAQVASDHTRGIEFHGFPISEPTTTSWKQWYFLCRLELGI
ncbi:MAG: hypothetical protein JWO30_4138 [Fibrobacteres bacterium]|nr:hypothetical protein [Fibrobacterota bacterium]